MKSGFIAILGKPNVGKSSLMNALVGEKVSIVTPKAQTTRDKILGIYTDDDCQMIFVDTPGVHKPMTKLGEYMNKCVTSASNDVDAVVTVFSAEKGITDNDLQFIERYLTKGHNVFVVINKTDLSSYEKIYPLLDKLKPLTVETETRVAIKDVIPTSCKTKKNIDVLKKSLYDVLPDGVHYYSPDDFTDKSERYMICEIIREKALLYLQDEIPHGIGVVIQSMNTSSSVAEIEVDIVCEKETHKAIVIGKNGEMLKKIGERARVDVQKLLDKKVYLRLYVKVRDDWRNKKSYMSDIGYN